MLFFHYGSSICEWEKLILKTSMQSNLAIKLQLKGALEALMTTVSAMQVISSRSCIASDELINQSVVMRLTKISRG